MKTPKQKEFLRLVRLYLSGKGTDKQNRIVTQYFDLFSGEEDILEKEDRKTTNEIGCWLKSGIDLRIKNSEQPMFYIYKKYISAAAAILVLSATGLIVYQTYCKVTKPSTANALTDIGPGSNKAVLMLSDGRKILLTNQHNGVIAEQAGVKVSKTGDGSLTYQNVKGLKVKTVYNIVSTPRGGQYQLNLPDGSKVWLNAASSIRYPVIFGEKERKVELRGEAYFEITKNVGQPFKVITEQQKVEVLGTHFNINAYEEEAGVETSLLEGKVKIVSGTSNAMIFLRPGEQALLTVGDHNQSFFVKRIDVDEAVAWKNGYFVFDDEPIESILRKVSRWYDVDVEYQENQKNSKLSFSGTLSKYSNISKVLKKLELTGSIHFKVEGRRVLVM